MKPREELEAKQDDVSVTVTDESELLPPYSLFKDSVLGKHTGNTASLFSFFDAIINCLSSRLDSVNYFFAEQMPFFITGLYYLLPLGVPIVSYIRQRCYSKPEKYDPDALELLNVLKQNDEEYQLFFKDNPREEEHILEITTDFIKYAKSQSFTMSINLIFLSLRAIHGLFIFSRELDITSKETSNTLVDWTYLLSSISNMTYMAIMMLHNNFQKYHFIENKKQHIRKHTLSEDGFFAKLKNRIIKRFNAELTSKLLTPSSSFLGRS